MCFFCCCARVMRVHTFVSCTRTYEGVWGYRLWCLMPLSTLFLAISRQSVLLVEEIEVPGENH